MPLMFFKGISLLLFFCYQLGKIQQNGSTDIEALNDPKILKSPDQIKEYLEYCKRSNKTEEVLKINATHANDTKLVRK